MIDRSGGDLPRYQAVLRPHEWEQRMRVDHRHELLRIVAALAATGIVITEETAFAAWRRFSEEDRCATWYGLGSDDEIRRHLLSHLELHRAGE